MVVPYLETSSNHLSTILQQFHDFYSLVFGIFSVLQLFCGGWIGSARSDDPFFTFQDYQEESLHQ